MCGSPKRDKLAAVRVPPNISHRRGSVTIVPWGIQMPRVGRQRLYRNCENSAGLAWTKERKRGVNYNEQRKITGTGPKKMMKTGSVRCAAACDHVRLRGLCDSWDLFSSVRRFKYGRCRVQLRLRVNRAVSRHSQWNRRLLRAKSVLYVAFAKSIPAPIQATRLKLDEEPR